MQAPITPEEPPAREPGGLTCPACGAGNGTAAAFCWQCFRPFPVRPAGRPTTGTGIDVRSLPAPPPRRNLAGMIAVISVAVAVVATAVFLLTGKDDVRLPEAFGGLQQIQDRQVELAIDQFRRAVDAQNVDGDLGLYGEGGIPTAALVWVRDASVPSTDEAFTAFSDGFNTGLPGGLDPSHTSSGSVDGVEYVCASLASVPPAAMCLWRADGVFWMLFDLDGAGRVRAAQDLAVAAHDAVR